MINVAAGVCLGAVLAYSGYGKARSFDSAGEGAIGMGVPRVIAKPLVVVLSLLEWTLALGLAVEPTRRASAVVAIALLLLFSLLITVNLILRRKPPCNCFGASSARPIGLGTLARNFLLMALAVIAGNWYSTISVMGLSQTALLWTMSLGEALVLGVVCWLLVKLAHQQGRLIGEVRDLSEMVDRLSAPISVPFQSRSCAHSAVPLEAGSSLPQITVNASGEPVREAADLLNSERPTAFVFLSEHCSPCKSLIDDHLSAWQAKQVTPVAVIPLLEGPPSSDIGIRNWLEEGKLTALGVRGLPAAVLVGPDGRVCSTTAYGREAIVTLIERGASPAS